MMKRKNSVGLFYALLGFFALSINARAAEQVQSLSKVTFDNNGTVYVPAHEVPLSAYMSAEAKRAYINEITHLQQPAADIAKVKAAYPVSTEAREMAGVRTLVILPKEGIAEENRYRVLINLVVCGSTIPDAIGLNGSAPIASIARIKVVSIDFSVSGCKLAVAREGATGVYKELLKQYKPKNIGVYGCGSGGYLTAVLMPWFQKKKLPTPGAIGVFCVGADALGVGDSRYLASSFAGSPPRLHIASAVQEYYGSADLGNPLLSPSLYPEVLSNFPPTLIINGMRDYTLSSALHVHAQLVKLGREAELHVWEGMWHGAYFDATLPESKEAYAVVAKFFNSYLGRP